MKSLTTYLDEALIVNKGSKKPRTPEDLRKIIMKIYQTQGPGTKNRPIDLNGIDVSLMTSFYDKKEGGIFRRTPFEYIDISDWDVRHVTDMHGMFYESEQLKSVGDLSAWDVSKVKDMSFMFYKCEQLTSVGDLSHWDVRPKTDMNGMFDRANRRLSIPDWYED